jgi:hypothetical protein
VSEPIVLRSSLSWMALSLILFASRTGRADADLETIRVIYEAPTACPSADAFGAEVRRASPRVRLTDDDDDSVRLFRVDIQAEPRARGRLTITDHGSLIGSRDVEGATCEEVSRVLAFAVALAIESRADRPPDRVATPFAVPEPSAPRAEPLRPPSAPFSHAWWAISVHSLAASGLAPNPASGGGPSADFGRRIGSLTPVIRVGLE